MLIKNYKRTKCPFGCNLFNDESNYHYWEDKKVTSDEIHILDYIKNNFLHKKSKILHVGIGNSYIAKNINDYDLIDGISLSQNEIDLAKEKGIKNYNIFFQNKYSENNIIEKRLYTYDIIIDANLKSFSCCTEAFENLFKLYSNLLNKDGIIITSKKGMNWSRQIRPKWAFSISKFFHKKLKEFDGPENNKLKDNECFLLAEKYNLKFYNTLDEIAYFKNE